MGQTNLVLLNPPFSCRGGKRVSATARGITVRCSVGLAFVVNSLDYLAEGGELITVLPEGSLTSEKDATTWSLLRCMAEIDMLKSNGLRTFSSAAIRTTVVRVKKRHLPADGHAVPIVSTCNVHCSSLSQPVHIVRGTTQVTGSPACGGLRGFHYLRTLNRPPRALGCPHILKFTVG